MRFPFECILHSRHTPKPIGVKEVWMDFKCKITLLECFFFIMLCFFVGAHFKWVQGTCQNDFLVSAEFLHCLHTVIDNPYSNLFPEELLFTY